MEFFIKLFIVLRLGILPSVNLTNPTPNILQNSKLKLTH